MSEVARIQRPTPPAVQVSEDDLVRVLQGSLYPGARADSIRLVLSWCRATGRDPMKKPIHIVPMWVKDAVSGQGEMRDVLMPGIGTYRTDAANSGMYAGKSEPIFGPSITMEWGNVKVTYPEWCKVTVQRVVHGSVRDFTALERWTENYATAKKDTDAPNAMWRRRPFGQLAKCAESQALRMAFPDETGNTNTAEEMEGKSFEGVTIDAPPQQRQVNETADPAPDDTMPTLDEPAYDKVAAAVDRLVAKIMALETEDAMHGLAGDPKIADYRAKLAKDRPDLENRIAAAFGDRYQELIQPRLDAEQAAAE